MRVLHVEDSRFDAQLVGKMLTAEWPGCELVVADDREAVSDALRGGPFDLILSDFTMGGFSGLDALSLAKEFAPETPFVFLSGTIGEDRAIEAVKAGAADYVLKERISRLVPVIHRALREVEERRRRAAAEEQLLRAQRVENIGLLASGIAHDLNNVLAPILMAVPMLRDRVTDEGNRKLLTMVERSAERGAGLVRQILGFAHGHTTGDRSLVDLRHLVREIALIVVETFPKKIRFETDIAADVWPVKASATHLHQVLINLCVNARDAMPQGGTLRVAAENCTLDSDAAAAIENGRPGPYVLVRVEDTGTGIPPEVLARIWEPFFTTKGRGKGTGLGLSTARGIVANHGGFIELKTAVEQGTSFRLYLPPAESAAGAADSAAPSPQRRGNGELVLVVDDESHVRQLAAAILSVAGYRVMTASDGREALAIYGRRRDEIRLVISDTQMPNLDGPSLAAELRRIDPSVMILAMSGLSPERNGGNAQSEEYGSRFLRKPFRTDDLLQLVHELIQARGPVEPRS